MKVSIKPSDLQYRYPRKKETRGVPKFRGTPDPHPFDRDDLYEVIPMFEAVMNALGTVDGRILHRLEEILNDETPRFVETREEIYDYLTGTMGEFLGMSVRSLSYEAPAKADGSRIKMKAGSVRKADRGDTVTVHYIGTLDNGRIFDRTPEDESLRFKLGAKEVFPALEEAVCGMAAGEVKNVLIPAAEAYGPRRQENVVVMKKGQLPPDVEPKVGMKMQIRLGSGRELIMAVTAIDEDAVTLDGNHALAGLDLTFALRLDAIDR